jgi:hypothetical protein
MGSAGEFRERCVLHWFIDLRFLHHPQDPRKPPAFPRQPAPGLTLSLRHALLRRARAAFWRRFRPARFDEGRATWTHIMIETIRQYRGLEIHPLVYPRSPHREDGSHNYESGFDASVQICRRGADNTITGTRVFRVSGDVPFPAAGEARLASARFAERLIDGEIEGQSIDDL